MPELARGKTGRVVGHLTGLLTLLKGLPLAYNRDLQEDKEAVFDTVDTLLSSLDVMAALLPGVSFRSEKMRESAGAGLSFATDLAEHLALRGVPFRQAHAAVGKLVRWCLEENRLPGEITLTDLQRFSPRFDQAAVKLISVDASVRSKKVPGGTAPTRVRAALKSARKQNI